jgi:hypothetical protein
MLYPMEYSEWSWHYIRRLKIRRCMRVDLNNTMMY